MRSDTLNSILKWLVILIAIACVSWAAISIYKHFHPSPPVFDPTTLQDSVSKREQKMRHIIDSLISRGNHLGGSADSLGAIAMQQKVELDKRKQITESLSDQYKFYRQKYDTIAALHACDTLSDEIIELQKAVNEYEESNGKLYDSLQSIVGIHSLVMAKKDYLYSTLRNSFDSLTFEYKKQSGTLQKAQKPKRWGIGPQIGVTYWSGFHVYGGIGISYNIFHLK